MFLDSKSSQDADTLCVLPWMHLEMRSYGVYAPCCVSSDAILNDADNKAAMIVDVLPSVAFHSRSMNSLRQELKNGKRSGNCQGCWDVEAYGGTSRRRLENERHREVYKKIKSGRFSYDSPLTLDIKFGNKCNLKCRICGPMSSSFWMDEHRQIYGVEGMGAVRSDVRPTDANFYSKTVGWPESSDHVWEKLTDWVHTVEEFELYGGEPFLNREMSKLLEVCIESGSAKNQTLRFNSNGTVFSKKWVEEIFPKFRKVILSLSLDGTFSQFEYQRHPAKWSLIHNNFTKYRDSGSCELTISLSVSALNIYYVPDYLQFWLDQGVKIHLNEVSGPEYFDIRILPEAAKAAVVARFEEFGLDTFDELTQTPVQSLLDKMNSADHSHLLKDFQAAVIRHDDFRGESYADVFPEFSIFMGFAGRLLKNRHTSTASLLPQSDLSLSPPL